MSRANLKPVPRSTLLEKALATTVVHRGAQQITADDRDLAVAWSNGDVGITQVGRAKKLPHNASVYVYLAIAIRDWYRREVKPL